MDTLMTLVDFADTMNRVVPREPNGSLEISVEVVRDLCRGADERHAQDKTPVVSTDPRVAPEEELRGLLRDRGLVLRGPFDPRARRLRLVRSNPT